jgi:chromosome segregation ATPase
MLNNHILLLENKIEELLNKYNELKRINASIESNYEVLLKKNKDLENRLKALREKEKQLKIIDAISDESENKQYFKNKIDYLIQEIDYCIERINI